MKNPGKISNIKQTVKKNHMSGDDWVLIMNIII